MEVNNENHQIRPLTVGIRGSGMGAGKDSVADFICTALEEREIEHRRERFATPVRECVEILTGVPPAESETAAGKSRELPEWGMTVGQMLQRLGTDAVRDHLHPDAWVLALMRRLGSEGVVVISDVRFPNEVEAIRARRGVIINVVREVTGGAAEVLAGRDPGHISEHAFVGGGDAADITIRNEGTLDDLRDNALRAVGRLYGYTG